MFEATLNNLAVKYEKQDRNKDIECLESVRWFINLKLTLWSSDFFITFACSNILLLRLSPAISSFPFLTIRISCSIKIWKNIENMLQISRKRIIKKNYK